MLNYQIFDRVLQVMYYKAKIEGASSHDFKYTAVTSMFETRIPTRTIASNLNI